MVTIVNTPAPSENSSNPIGMIIMLLVVVVLIYLGFVYGIPAIKQIQTPSAPVINVPSSIDVNIKQTQ